MVSWHPRAKACKVYGWSSTWNNLCSPAGTNWSKSSRTAQDNSVHIKADEKGSLSPNNTNNPQKHIAEGQMN